MSHYYLWRGTDAIEDLDDCTLGEAMRELKSKVMGDWTLWQRDCHKSYRATLVAIWLPENNVFQHFVPEEDRA